MFKKHEIPHNIYSHDQVKERLKKINISILSKYKGAKKKILYKCNICGVPSQETLACDVWNKGCLNCRNIKSKEKSRNKQIKIHGSLADHPYLVNEYDKSNPLKPEQIPNSFRPLLKWNCSKCGKKWKASPIVRLNPRNKKQKYRNCPKCRFKVSAKELLLTYLKKTGSLKDKYPELLKEWDYKKNKIKPENVSPHSSRNVWWICKKNHSWQAMVYNRTKHEGSGCPDCNNFKTSRAEIRVYAELAYIIRNIKWAYYLDKRQLDIYLMDHKLGVEVDGHYHIGREEKDKDKNIFFEKKGIEIIRLRDKKLKTKISENDYFVDTGKIHVGDLHKIYRILIKKNILFLDEKEKIKKSLNRKSFFNDKEYNRICSFLPGPPPEKSLEKLYPKIALQWDYKKNFPLQPSMFLPFSEQKAWWICYICNKSHKAMIKSKSRGHKCRDCGYKKRAKNRAKNLLIKKGSLKEKFPELSKQFMTQLNKIEPDKVVITSKMYAWWYCKKHDHQWQAYVYFRTMYKEHNCKKCWIERITLKSS